MSNHLGQIYSTTKNAEKYIVLNSQNVELSGNVKLTNGNLNVSQNLIFNNFSVTDKINFRENSGSTSYNIINNSLTSNNDASLNNVEINGTIKLPDSSNNGYGVSGQILQSNGSGSAVSWTTPTSTNISFKATTSAAGLFQFSSGWPLFSGELTNVTGHRGSFNNGSAFNTSTGLFTAPETGLYYLCGVVMWNTGSFNAGYVVVNITTPATSTSRDNAILTTGYGANEPFAQNFTQTVSGIASLVAGEQIGVYVYAQNFANASIERRFCFFMGYKIN
jgi:hypothetical protein